FSVKATQVKHAPITMQVALVCLACKLNPKNTNDLNIISIQSQIKQDIYEAKNENITQERFYNQLSKFMKESGVLLAEQGTSFYGAATMPIPKDTMFIGQPLWGSIGFTLPALLGSQLADTSRRNILL